MADRYRNSHSILDHAVLPATRQRRYSRLYPSQLKLALDLLIPEGCKAESILLSWLHTKVVYPPEDSHPSQYELGQLLLFLFNIFV